MGGSGVLAFDAPRIDFEVQVGRRRPVANRNPCMWAAGAFRGFPASIITTRRRARPRTRAALDPAEQPPTTATSSLGTSRGITSYFQVTTIRVASPAGAPGEVERGGASLRMRAS
jgi:hypothetical protein